MKPLHTILRQYRVLQLGLILFLCYVTYELTEWMTQSPFSELSDWHVAPITATLPALVAGLFALANSVMKKNEIDDHDRE
jgi:hypothetical protein